MGIPQPAPPRAHRKCPLANDISVRGFAHHFGRTPGYVSGFAPDTAAATLFARLRHRMDFRATIESLVSAGGDIDTVAGVAGSLAAIECGVPGITQDWKNGLCDRPLNPRRRSDAEALNRLPHPSRPLFMIHNALSLGIVLAHPFRRILPPSAGDGKNPADIGTL